MRRTGILDVNGTEILEGDIIKTDVGTTHEIFWDEDKQSLMARPTDEVDEKTRGFLTKIFGEEAFKPMPFQGINDLIGFALSCEIVKRA